MSEKACLSLGLAEQYADGLVSDEVRSAARREAQRAAQTRGTSRLPTAPKPEGRAASSVYHALARQAGEAAWNAPNLVIEAVIWQAGGYTACLYAVVRSREEEAQFHLVREIFGNPFRPVGFDPAWLTSDVTLLAQGIYEDRAFDRMPILADALQDAGCEDEQILAHCRDAALTHVRGCWVVDLIWGKSEVSGGPPPERAGPPSGPVAGYFFSDAGFHARPISTDFSCFAWIAQGVPLYFAAIS